MAGAHPRFMLRSMWRMAGARELRSSAFDRHRESDRMECKREMSFWFASLRCFQVVWSQAGPDSCATRWIAVGLFDAQFGVHV